MGRTSLVLTTLPARAACGLPLRGLGRSLLLDWVAAWAAGGSGRTHAAQSGVQHASILHVRPAARPPPFTHLPLPSPTLPQRHHAALAPRQDALATPIAALSLHSAPTARAPAHAPSPPASASLPSAPAAATRRHAARETLPAHPLGYSGQALTRTALLLVRTAPPVPPAPASPRARPPSPAAQQGHQWCLRWPVAPRRLAAPPLLTAWSAPALPTGPGSRLLRRELPRSQRPKRPRLPLTRRWLGPAHCVLAAPRPPAATAGGLCQPQSLPLEAHPAASRPAYSRPVGAAQAPTHRALAPARLRSEQRSPLTQEIRPGLLPVAHLQVGDEC
jgi:hypothetical protein